MAPPERGESIERILGVEAPPSDGRPQCRSCAESGFQVPRYSRGTPRGDDKGRTAIRPFAHFFDVRELPVGVRQWHAEGAPEITVPIAWPSCAPYASGKCSMPLPSDATSFLLFPFSVPPAPVALASVRK